MNEEGTITSALIGVAVEADESNRLVITFNTQKLPVFDYSRSPFPTVHTDLLWVGDLTIKPICLY